MLNLSVWVSVPVAISIVEIGILLRQSQRFKSFKRNHFPNIPQFQKLVFTIACNIDSVTFTTDVGDSFGVANEYTSWSTWVKCPAIPDLDHGVVWPSQDYVTLLSIYKTNTVNFVSMCGLESSNHAIADQVITKQLCWFRGSNNLLSVTWKFSWHDTSSSDALLMCA